MKRFTGVASSDAWWLHRSKILWQRCGGKRVARLALNFSCSSGMPSARRRRWPSGYSTATWPVLLPSSKNTSTALAMERLSASRYSRL